ncbi:hypothetical protein Tco_1490966 [Tanacetum coccineum]
MACSSAHFLKSSDFKVLSSLMFQARGACLNPYNAFITAMASSNLMVSILATGANTSSKSMPCSCWCECLELVSSANVGDDKNPKSSSYGKSSSSSLEARWTFVYAMLAKTLSLLAWLLSLLASYGLMSSSVCGTLFKNVIWRVNSSAQSPCQFRLPSSSISLLT